MPDLKCNVCGAEFPPVYELHYISRDSKKTGLVATINSTDEPAVYDSYDCPYCGCQVIAKQRKHLYHPTLNDLADRERLEMMDDKTIADYLGLDPEIIERLREKNDEQNDEDDDGLTQIGFNYWI